MRFELTPLNEGQDINIWEERYGSFREAVKRASRIVNGLSRLFPQATFLVRIRTSSGRTFYVDGTETYTQDFERFSNLPEAELKALLAETDKK